MAVEARRLSPSEVAFICTQPVLTGFTYGATLFTWIRTAAQVAAFPHLVAIGAVAGILIRYLGEHVLMRAYDLCCPCTPGSRFRHRLVNAGTSLPMGVLIPLKTIDPFSLGLSSAWMLGSCYKECFFTNADFGTGKPRLFGV